MIRKCYGYHLLSIIQDVSKLAREAELDAVKQMTSWNIKEEDFLTIEESADLVEHLHAQREEKNKDEPESLVEIIKN